MFLHLSVYYRSHLASSEGDPSRDRSAEFIPLPMNRRPFVTANWRSPLMSARGTSRAAARWQ
jgi:hypothetical protein